MEESETRSQHTYLLMVKAAWYYYVENYTQQRVSELMGLSRARVIALLEQARASGIVQFSLRSDATRRMRLEESLMTRFGLRDVFLVPQAAHLTDPIESVAQAASMYILRRITPTDYINLGYGDASRRVLSHLATNAENPVNVVSLTGGAGHYLPYKSGVFNARLHLIPAPLLVSSAQLRDSLMAEPDVQRIFSLLPLSTFTVLGVGHMGSTATILRRGVLGTDDYTQLKMRRAVGDILCHFIDADGRPVAPYLDARLLSTSLDQIKKQKNVVGVAAGPEKAAPVLGALRAGYLDVLITDEGLAQSLLDRA